MLGGKCSRCICMPAFFLASCLFVAFCVCDLGLVRVAAAGWGRGCTAMVTSRSKSSARCHCGRVWTRSSPMMRYQLMALLGGWLAGAGAAGVIACVVADAGASVAAAVA